LPFGVLFDTNAPIVASIPLIDPVVGLALEPKECSTFDRALLQHIYMI